MTCCWYTWLGYYKPTFPCLKQAICSYTSRCFILAAAEHVAWLTDVKALLPHKSFSLGSSGIYTAATLFPFLQKETYILEYYSLHKIYQHTTYFIILIFITSFQNDNCQITFLWLIDKEVSLVVQHKMWSGFLGKPWFGIIEIIKQVYWKWALVQHCYKLYNYYRKKWQVKNKCFI